MAYVAVLLGLVLLVLAVRHFVLLWEMNRITRDLHNSDIDVTKEKLTIKILNNSLENLCKQVNQRLTDLSSLCIAAGKHERELRTQIASISHDLRTPLTAILGYITIMKSMPEKSAEYLQIIENRALALQALIEQFYELSVMEDSSTILELEPVDATSVLTNCMLGNYPH